MNFENSFTVQAPIDEVWATLMDLERVAPAVPGAEVLARTGDDAYKVAVRVKLGPMSMLYRGQVEIAERDDAAHHAVMSAKAMETRGQGAANASVRMSLAEQPDGTHAAMDTDLQLSGRAAAMGAGVISDVAATLVEEFAANLARMLSSEPAAQAGSATVAQPGGSAVAADIASGPPPAGVTPPPAAASRAGAPPPRQAGAASSVPVGRIAASVIGKRLSDPKTLLITGVGFAVGFTALGFAIGRAR